MNSTGKILMKTCLYFVTFQRAEKSNSLPIVQVMAFFSSTKICSYYVVQHDPTISYLTRSMIQKGWTDQIKYKLVIYNYEKLFLRIIFSNFFSRWLDLKECMSDEKKAKYIKITTNQLFDTHSKKDLIFIVVSQLGTYRMHIKIIMALLKKRGHTIQSEKS